ncbi:MAG: hypothetical protein L0Z62_26650 [Gemmataceae bacterium]|nr:hypothetical protein [Gemmataceae bacterium]
MSTNRHTEAECNGALFIENSNQFPREELARFAGGYVAWNLEGTQIVASGADEDDLHANLAAAGLRVSEVVQSYVPGPGEDTLL